jgi:uncharacterized membrane protein (UPF0127 family)
VIARALPLLVVGIVACAKAKAPDPGAAAPHVVVETAAGPRHSVAVELARTDAERARGLMFRKSLAPDAGMLFLFEESAEHGFWMQNTLIPLDMIFVDDGGRIVGIVERAEPLTTTLRTVGVPSRYVLEVNGGWATAHGVARGDRVRFEGVPRF